MRLLKVSERLNVKARLSVILPVLLFVGFSAVASSRADIGKPITTEYPLPQSEVERLRKEPPTVDVDKLKREMRPDESEVVVVAGKETAGATISDEIFWPATVRLPADVYADGMIITQNCPPDVACEKMPALVLRTLDDKAIAWIDGDGRLIQREEGNRFAGVEIIKTEVSK